MAVVRFVVACVDHIPDGESKYLLALEDIFT